MNKSKLKKIKKASELLKLLSHESRLLILCQLSEGEKSVSKLMEISNLSQSAFSQHLAKLRNEGLVESRKESLCVYYRIASFEVKEIINTLHELYCK